MSSCLRRIGDLLVGSIALALVCAPSAGAALPAGYSASPTDNPPANSNVEHFGANMVNAGDVNGDGVDDLLVGVPDAPSGLPGITGKIVYISGKDGSVIRTIRPPDSDTLISHLGAPTAFGAQVATIGDLNGDHVPEHVVSAPGSDISSKAVDMGIVYVYDGASANILKRIELAPDDRPPSSPGFGKALTSAVGEPACVGFGGTAPCPDAPSSLVARGDLDGRGTGDIVIGAPDYAETATAANETNPSACPAGGPTTCPGLGRIYVYSGEDIKGAPGTPLDTPTFSVLYPDPATAAEQPHLGASLAPIGDVGACAYDETKFVPKNSSCLVTNSQIRPDSTPDGYPDFLASAPGLSSGGITRAGKTFVVEGHHALLVAALDSPDPQQDSGFGPPASHQPAPGNLGGSGLPDIYLAATGQNLAAGLGQGRGYAISGDVTSPTLLARVDDPAPSPGGGFGVSAGLGDIAGADDLSEFALGRLSGGPITIMSSCGMRAIQTIPDADPGAAFGAAIVPMGDLNGDGYLDLAVGAPDHNGGVGRVYLMKSNGTPGPDPSCRPPDGGGGGGGGGSGSGGGLPSGGGGGTPSRGTTGSKKARSLAKRSISLRASSVTAKVGESVQLVGTVRASKNKRSCQAKQRVAIQRLNPDGNWPTVDLAVTKKNGSFVSLARLLVAQPFSYRARVKQTRQCAASLSKSVKIKVSN